MPRRPKYLPKETEKGWQVSVPATMSGSGKRMRRYFPDERSAEKYARGLRASYHAGERGGMTKPHLAKMAEEAEEILAPFGITILEAARIVVDLKTAKEEDDFGESYGERFAAFVAKMENDWRPKYALSMAKIPRWVGPVIMKMPWKMVTPEVLKAALAANGAAAESTLKARMLRAQSVLSSRGGKRRGSKIHILTFQEIRDVFRADRTPEARRTFALLLFAGIRPDADGGEIARLDWEDIGEKEIYISPDVSKTGTDRYIPMTPRLRRLLRGRPKSGPVAPAGWKKTYQRAREAAKLGARQDLFRHTFASHFLEHFGEEAAKAAMGHTAGSDTLFRNYRRAISAGRGASFFGIKKKADAKKSRRPE